ncbi:MAG: hypothetical protein JO202_07065 [Ktedonobacteraceae bacterium]|nr:hypothetical protein [Ktedonobacteraceae bacterium]
MDNLLSLAQQEFDGAEATHLFEAAIPLAFLDILVEALETQKLNSFESYFLHALDKHVRTLSEIAWLYGLEERDLYASGANLLRYGYIWEGAPKPEGGRPLFLTEKGEHVVRTQKTPPVPVRRNAHLHFNLLTWSATPLEKQCALSADQMTAEGLCILPAQRPEQPTLVDLTPEKITVALHEVPFFNNKRILALLALERSRAEYLAPVQVVYQSEQRRLAVFRRGLVLRNETDVLQRFLETGKFHLPDDAISLTPQPPLMSLSLPEPLAAAASRLSTNETTKRRVDVELQEQKNQLGTTQSEQERVQMERRIRDLEAALHTLQAESGTLRRRIEQQQGAFLKTEEHRAFLEQALSEARDEIIIISPWLNRRTCDDALCQRIAEATKRGVKVRIGYGINEQPGSPDAGRNRSNAQRVIRALQEAVAQARAAPELLDIQRVSDTHEKILVCDRHYGTLGSFNWLSYRGELDRQYRSETSTVLRDPQTVEELARIALSGWPTARPREQT